MSPDRKQQIIDAASTLIAQKGFEGLRTREVADIVGINHATVHYHFKDKETLIEAVVKDITEQIYQSDIALIDQQTHNAQAQLKQAFRNHLHQRQQHPERFLVMAEISLRANRTPAIARIVRDHEEDTYARMQSFIATGIKQGDFRPDLDAQAIAVMLITLWRGIRLQLSQTDIDRYMQVHHQIEQDLLT